VASVKGKATFAHANVEIGAAVELGRGLKLPVVQERTTKWGEVIGRSEMKFDRHTL